MGLTYLDTVPLLLENADDPHQVNISNWYAVHNPILFKFQRRDFTVSSVTDDGSGNAKITLSSPNTDKLILVAVGQSAYIYALTTGIDYTGVFTVIGTDNSTYITIDTPYIGDASDTGSFINANDLVGYYADVRIGPPANPWQYARYIPLLDGTLTVDIAGFVRRKLPIQDNHFYDLGNLFSIDPDASITTKVYIRERYNGEPSIPAYTNLTLTIPVECINAAKQIGDEYGSNMALYTPFPQTTGWNAKFLTLFDDLIFWMGYPFDLAVIIPIQAYTEYAGHFVLDIIHSPGGQEVATTITPTDVGVWRINIIDDMVTYAALIAEYVTVKIITDGTPQDDQLTEEKKILVRQCTQNSIYLKWLNTLGGWSYWMFEFDQQKAIAVSDPKTFQKYIEDLATADSDLQYLSKKAFPKMVIGADGVSESNIKGLKGILYSPKVQWLTNPDTWQEKGAAKWQTVLVNPGSFNLESTREGFANIELTIEFPEINIQTQ